MLAMWNVMFSSCVIASTMSAPLRSFSLISSVIAVAAAALPQLGRVQHRHQQLLPADRVHLLADDLHDLLVHAPARRHPRPQPGAELPDHARADEQLVRERLGVGGRLLLGREEVARRVSSCGRRA